MESTGTNNKGPDNTNIIVNNGGLFDLQSVSSFLLNKLGLSTTGIKGKAHIPSYNFNGVGTSLFYVSEERPG